MVPASTSKLDRSRLKHLKSLCHHLKPIVQIGQKGLRDSVIEEIEQGLQHHELIKIKISAERETRKQMTGKISNQTRAEVIQSIGQMVCLFRRNSEEPKIKF